MTETSAAFSAGVEAMRQQVAMWLRAQVDAERSLLGAGLIGTALTEAHNAVLKMPAPLMQKVPTETTMPIDPWTGEPYGPSGVLRIKNQLVAAHVIIDESDRGAVSAGEALWRLKVALGRIAKA